jgi:phospholipid transport system substrate-binding protein
MKNFLASRTQALFFCIAMLASSLAQATWEEAGLSIEGATQQMLGLMEDESLREESQEDLLIDEIGQILDPVVDFDYIAKVVMGKYYRRASKEERIQFSKVFRTTLLKTYATAMVGFKIEKYLMVPPREKSPSVNKQIVTVAVFAPDGTKYSLVYYMKHKAGEWRLVNALLDGINLRLTFKNQFADMMQRNKGKVADVIASWKEKVDPGKSEA